MEAFEIKDLDHFISSTNFLSKVFNSARIIDAVSGFVLYVKDGKVFNSGIRCIELLGNNERCKNCSSLRALYANEQIVKIEYLNDTVLLVISVPMFHEGRGMVVELFKDITMSMTLDVKDDSHSDEVLNIIDNLNKLATTDQLTGLMNRRYIDDKLPNLLYNSMKIGRPLSVALVDVDFFKSINDNFGHPAGDYILSTLGQLFLSFIRWETDFAARYGGDEFLLCFSGAPLARCHEVCERIRLRVKETVFCYNGQEIPVSISIGCAESSETKNKSEGELIALADERLYKAKTDGRNKVAYD